MGYRDKGGSFDESKQSRPLGVTLLAILQIVGIVVMAAFLLLSPAFTNSTINEYFGIPLIEFMLVYIVIMIPISLFLAYGLLMGKEIARFTSILFQVSSAVTSIISFNLIGLIIPIYIVYYLRKPHVKQFFKTDKTRIKSSVKILIILGVIFLLVFNGYVAFLSNPMVIFDRMTNNAVSFKEQLLTGTWHNTYGTITLEFRSNHTCTAFKSNTSYNGTWSIEKHFYWVNLNWETPFKLKHPNNPEQYYLIDKAYLIGQNLSLYIMFESQTPPYYMCYKE